MPTCDGHKHAIIGAIGTPADAQGHTLKAVASLVSQAELDKVAVEKGEPLDAYEWVNVTSVGDYQEVLDRKLPYAVQVELFPWERGNSVTARVDGQRVGELPASVATRLHPVLRARRKAGMPPVVVRGEARWGGTPGGQWAPSRSMELRSQSCTRHTPTSGRRSTTTTRPERRARCW